MRIKIKELFADIVLGPILLILGLYTLIAYFFTDDMTHEQIDDLTRAKAMEQQERMFNHDIKSN